MDFTALSNKLRSLDPTTPQEDAAKLKAIATGKPVEEVVKQPITESVAPVQLDEMAQFKALAGIAGTSKTTKSELALEMAALAGIVNESKEVVAEAEQVIKAEKKQELPSKKSVLMMCSKGMSVKEMCEEYPDCDQEKLKEMCESCMEEYKKKKDESFDSSEFRKNFEAMVEAKKKMPMGPGPDGKKGTDDDKPAFLDQKTGDEKSKSDKKDGGMTDKQKKYFGKKNESVEEGKGKLKKGHPNYKKQAAAIAISKKTNESIEAMQENKPLSFKDLLGIVRESGGQQQIDCVDTTLWTWAQRVANAKYEGTKAEVFAGMLYERNGGRFEMHDMLSEDK